MKPVTLHPEARAELNAAADYYEGERAGFGRRFRLAFEAAVGRLCHRPATYPLELRDVRRCSLIGFPYTIMYLDEPNSIWIVAVAHQHRRPRYWAKRVSH